MISLNSKIIEMIFDNPPTFEEMIKGMKDLENALKSQGSVESCNNLITIQNNSVLQTFS